MRALPPDAYSKPYNAYKVLEPIAGNGNNISYKYNDSGIRTEKTVNGKTTKYHLVGDKVTQEVSGIDTIYYTYDAEQNLVSMNLNGSEYYYIRNGQGDIIGLSDDGGRQVVSYTYDTWGKLVNIDGPLASRVGEKNPYRYRGYGYDSETGLYYLQSRYYNPEFCRMLNADSLGGEVGTLLSHNVFTYCQNNSVNKEDPSGCWGIRNRLSRLYDKVLYAYVYVAANMYVFKQKIYNRVSGYSGKAIKSVKKHVNKSPNKGKGNVDKFIKNNVNKNFQQNVKNAFGTDAKVTTLTQDTTVYRYHGGNSAGKSYWYTPNQTTNPAVDLALPSGNTYKYMNTYVIPKGTTILEGSVAPNFGQPGGGYQFYVPDPTVVILK